MDDSQRYIQTTTDRDSLHTVEVPVAPEALILWQQCEKYGSLLFAGGVLEQPYLLWTEVQVAGNAYEEWRRIQGNLKPGGQLDA